MYTSHLALTVLLLHLLVADPGDDDRGVRQSPRNWSPWARNSIVTPGSPGSSGRGGGGSSTWRTCRTIEGPNGITYVECSGGPPGGPDSAFNAVVPGDPAAGPAITPEMMLEQALRNLSPPLPKVSTAPPRGRPGLVGLRHFYWADRTQWRPVTSRASAGPVWAEVTATPTQLIITPGAGQSSLTCTGPGTPYDQSKSPDRQQTGCTHLYTRSSAGLSMSQYTATISVRWSASWTGSGGAGGPLAPITVSTSFPVAIAEGQALIQRSS